MQATTFNLTEQTGVDGPQIDRLAREIVDAHRHFYRRGDQFEFTCHGDDLGCNVLVI